MEPLLSFDAAAELLGVSRRWLEVLTAQRRIPSVKLGRRRLFEAQEIRRFVADHREGSHRP